MGYLNRRQWGILLAPLALGELYFIGTAGLFFKGPINWPPVNKLLLLSFLCFAFALLGLGFLFGTRTKTRTVVNKSYLRVVVAVGALTNLALLFPAAYVYTGSLPWDFFKALGDQRAAYEQMQGVLATGMPFRAIVAAARAVFGPATVVLPALSILLWGKIGTGMRCIAVAGLLSMFAFSVFRGTDKETFDLAILQVAALGVLCCRYVASRRTLPAARFWLAAAVILLMVSVMINSFVDRKAQRMGFQAEQRVEQGAHAANATKAMTPAYCISSNICSYPLDAGAKLSQVRLNFALSMISAYVAQGYYGLSLALEKPFESMYGLGHSTLLTRAFVAVTKDQAFADRALTTRLGDDGWDVRYQWSSAYAWFANDVGVWGSALVVGGLAFLWG